MTHNANKNRTVETFLSHWNIPLAKPDNPRDQCSGNVAKGNREGTPPWINRQQENLYSSALATFLTETKALESSIY
jgi:hypothetical protein